MTPVLASGTQDAFWVVLLAVVVGGALIAVLTLALTGKLYEQIGRGGLSIADEAERRIRDYCELRRARIVAQLAGIPRIRAVVPEAGMFMLVDVRGTGLSGYEFMRALYESERVSVLDGAAFGRETAGFVRICFATDEVLLDSGCERIARFVRNEAAGGA